MYWPLGVMLRSESDDLRWMAGRVDNLAGDGDILEPAAGTGPVCRGEPASCPSSSPPEKSCCCLLGGMKQGPCLMLWNCKSPPQQGLACSSLVSCLTVAVGHEHRVVALWLLWRGDVGMFSIPTTLNFPTGELCIPIILLVLQLPQTSSTTSNVQALLLLSVFTTGLTQTLSPADRPLLDPSSTGAV